MATDLTKNEFVEILLDTEITKPTDINILHVFYSCKGYKASASDAGRMLGYAGKRPANPLNSWVGRYAKRIASKHDIDFSIRKNQKYKFWDLFFEGEDDGHSFIWKLRHNLVEALQETNLTGDYDQSNKIPDEIADKFPEGAKRLVLMNMYERSPQARKRCIEKHGTKCVICGFDFSVEYGEIGKGFIHVHHLTPVYEMSGKYDVDPATDLVPLCPNCHAMIHKSEKMLSVDELRQLYREAQGFKQ